MFSVIHCYTRICFKGAFSNKITNPEGEGPVQIDKQRIVAKGEGIGFTFPKHTPPSPTQTLYQELTNVDSFESKTYIFL